MPDKFEPRIVALCCHYCAYGAADLAGSMRMTYPDAIRVVRMPCTGKLDAMHILSAFEEGADGVMVAGCLEGDCHFLEGNYNAKRRVKYVAGLLDDIGVGGKRLKMFNLSSAMGARWAEICNEMYDLIKKQGPSPLNVN